MSEYQELKAQAALASLADGDSPGAKEGGAAGEVWMRLDQKNKVGIGLDRNHIHYSQKVTNHFVF